MSKVIYKKKGELIPEQLLELLFKGKPTIVDCVMVDNGELRFAHPDNVGTREELKELQEVFKDYPGMFYFGYGSEYLTDDRQPSVLVRNSKDQPVLAVCMQGDFSPYHDEKSAHSDEFHALNKYFRPKLQKIFSLCKEDVAPFLDELRDTVMVEELSTKTFLGEGSIEVLAITGEVFAFANDSKRKEFKWGFTTDTLGHSESEYPVPEKPKGGLAQSLGLPGFTPKKTEAPKAKPEPETKQVIKPPITPAKVEEELVFPPAEIQAGSKNQKRVWYNQMFGFCPGNYKNSPGVLRSRLKQKGPIKALSDIPRNVPGPDPNLPANRDAQEKIVDIPIIPDVKKKQIVENFLESKTISKLLADQTPFDPKVILEMEGKYPTFCESLGLKLTDTFKWSLASKRELCRRWPDEAGVLIQDLTRALLMADVKPPWIEEDKPETSSLPGFKPKKIAM